MPEQTETIPVGNVYFSLHLSDLCRETEKKEAKEGKVTVDFFVFPAYNTAVQKIGRGGFVSMEYFEMLLPLALILFFSKLLSKLCEKLHLPQVVGLLLAGVLLGVLRSFTGQSVISDVAVEGLGFLAKIGVILIMFSAGLETDVKQIRTVGIPAVLITIAGVAVPMGLGFLAAWAFQGFTSETVTQSLFYGCILTATSVSVTVASLKELGKLQGKVGGTIVAAAILDDIIGVVLLSFIIAIGAPGGSAENPWLVLLKTCLFFVFALAFGWLFRVIFRKLSEKMTHHRTIPIMGLAACFFFAYASERWFGVADITGAFFAGLMLSGNRDAAYIDRRSDIMSYMVFGPVFFANIGITADFSGLTAATVAFGICYILLGLAGKVIGCGATARLCKYSARDSLRIGVGMMVRAEVALICAQRGVDSGIIDASILPFLLLMIILSSFSAPVILKASYDREREEKVASTL